MLLKFWHCLNGRKRVEPERQTDRQKYIEREIYKYTIIDSQPYTARKETDRQIGTDSGNKRDRNKQTKW